MVRTTFFILVALLLLPSATLQAGSVPGKPLSLHECISIALGNASSLKKAENALHLEGVDLLKSYGAFLPKVTSSASFIPRSVNRSYTSGSGSSDVSASRIERSSVDFSLTTSLNLFNGLSDYASLQSALDLKHSAAYSLRRAKESVAYDVTQHYYQVLLDQELLGIARENLRSSRDLLTLTDRQFNIGLKSITDLYQQQAEVSNNNLSVIRAENALRRSKLELARRLRLDPDTGINLEPVDIASTEKLSPEFDIETLTAQSLKRRSDLEAQALETDAARWQVRKIAGSRLPRLDLALTMSSDAIDSYKTSQSGLTYDYSYPSVGRQLADGVDYTISLNLSWTIFDGFSTRYNVETAKMTRLNKQLDYQDLREGIVIDLRQVASDYRAAFSQIDAARESLKAAQSAWDGIVRKYELGASGFVELSASRTALFNARSTVTQAVYNLALQKALLDYTSGTTSIE